jgi:uroporphyrin-III C-methyltransferase
MADVPHARATVYLVGAGPGDPELLTLKAVKILAKADVIVHDRLVSDAVMKVAPDHVMRISVGKAPGRHSYRQSEINALLVHLAGQGHRAIVRLKGGDPFIFGRACEEIEALEAHGIAWDVVPGITAAQGCAASARLPLTHRGMARSLRFVTGHCRADTPLDFDWRSLADPQTTLVFYMGHAAAGEISAKLIEHGLRSDMPALCVSQGTTPHETRLSSRLDRLPADLKKAQLPSPILIVIGEAVGWTPAATREASEGAERDDYAEARQANSRRLDAVGAGVRDGFRHGAG